MAENLIGVYAIYTAPHYTGFNLALNQVSVNVDRLNAFTPRFAYLVRYMVPGNNQVQFQLTFEVSSVDLLDPNTITGVYIEQDGKGLLVDATTVDAFITAANAGTAPPRKYAGGIPAFTNPTLNTFCVTRLDDGSGSSVDNFVMDYVGKYVTMSHKSNVSGTSKYQVNAYGSTFTTIGADTVANGAC